MTCQECTELLLEETDAGELDRAAVLHLSECEDCHGLAGELRANAVALRSMREDVVPSKPVVLGPNVLPMRVAEKHPRQLYWLAAAAALVVAVGLGVMRMNRADIGTPALPQEAAIARPEVAAVLPQIARPTVSALEERAKNRQERQARQAARSQRVLVRQLASRGADRQTASSGSQAALKILTADPNVVIYWLGSDTNAEGNDEGEIL